MVTFLRSVNAFHPGIDFVRLDRLGQLLVILFAAVRAKQLGVVLIEIGRAVVQGRFFVTAGPSGLFFHSSRLRRLLGSLEGGRVGLTRVQVVKEHGRRSLVIRAEAVLHQYRSERKKYTDKIRVD